MNEAVTLLEYVVARDPVNPRSSWNLGRSYFYAGRLDEAISSFRASLNLSPEAIGRLSWIGLALIFKDEPEAALEAIQQESDDPDRLI